MAYPRMIYKTREKYCIVHSEEEHKEHAAEGWLNHWEDATPHSFDVEVAPAPKEDPIPEKVEEAVKLSPQQRGAITRAKNKAKKGG